MYRAGMGSALIASEMRGSAFAVPDPLVAAKLRVAQRERLGTCSGCGLTLYEATAHTEQLIEFAQFFGLRWLRRGFMTFPIRASIPASTRLVLASRPVA